MWDKSKVLVTGGAGMIGSECARQLLSRGASVTVIDDLSRGRRPFVPQQAQFIQYDLRQGKLRQVIRDHWKSDYKFDYVIHLAAIIGGVGRMHAHQYESGENLRIDRVVFDYCKETSTPLYYQSTACTYPITCQTEFDSTRLLREDMVWPANPESLYGFAKLIGEEQAIALHREGFTYVWIGRAFNVIGPNEADNLAYSHVVPALCQKILLNESKLEVWGSGNQERAFLYVTDAVRGILTIMEKGTIGQAYNIGMPERYSISDIAHRLIKVSGKDLTVEFDLTKPEGVFTRAADTTKLQGLGWEYQVSIDDALEKTYNWWVNTGMDVVYSPTSPFKSNMRL